MYKVDMFFPLIFTLVILIVVFYFTYSKNMKDRNVEYLKFFLTYLIPYSLVFFIISLIIGDVSSIKFLFGVCFIPFMLLSYKLYPFKTVQRSKKFILYSLIVFLLIVGFLVLMILGHHFSNM